MQTALGLDLGTSCGWALATPAKVLCSGTWNNKIKTGVDSPSLRFIKFETALCDMLALSPDMVFYEIVMRHNGIKAAQMYGAFQAKMMEVCERYQVPYQGLGVGEIKKFATGKGNAGKEQMVEAARALGLTPTDDNEADAVHIARLGLSRYGG